MTKLMPAAVIVVHNIVEVAAHIAEVAAHIVEVEAHIIDVIAQIIEFPQKFRKHLINNAQNNRVRQNPLKTLVMLTTTCSN